MRSSLALRCTVGAWAAGTRVVVRREGPGPALVVSPCAQPAVELEVTVVDVVLLRRRATHVVEDRHEARAVLSRQLARAWALSEHADLAALEVALVRVERVVHVLERRS